MFKLDPIWQLAKDGCDGAFRWVKYGNGMEITLTDIDKPRGSPMVKDRILELSEPYHSDKLGTVHHIRLSCIELQPVFSFERYNPGINDALMYNGHIEWFVQSHQAWDRDHRNGTNPHTKNCHCRICLDRNAKNNIKNP